MATKYTCDDATAIKLVKKALNGKMAILGEKDGVVKAGTPPMMTIEITVKNGEISVKSKSPLGKPLVGTAESAIELTVDEYKEANAGSNNQRNAGANSNNSLDLDAQKKKIELLREYKQLLDDGIITDEEFASKKEELLNSNNQVVQAISSEESNSQIQEESNSQIQEETKCDEPVEIPTDSVVKSSHETDEIIKKIMKASKIIINLLPIVLVTIEIIFFFAFETKYISVNGGYTSVPASEALMNNPVFLITMIADFILIALFTANFVFVNLKKKDYKTFKFIIMSICLLISVCITTTMLIFEYYVSNDSRIKLPVYISYGFEFGAYISIGLLVYTIGYFVYRCIKLSKKNK